MPLALAEQILRLINLLLEGTPMEQRQAQSLIWFHLWWPLWKRVLPRETVEQVEQIMAPKG